MISGQSRERRGHPNAQKFDPIEVIFHLSVVLLFCLLGEGKVADKKEKMTM